MNLGRIQEVKRTEIGKNDVTLYKYVAPTTKLRYAKLLFPNPYPS